MKTSQLLEAEIGSRVARLRLSQNITQAMLAQEAGIAVRTLRRLESGQPSTLDTFLRVALALNLDETILSVLPAGHIRPIERVSKIRAERRRARPKPHPNNQSINWVWGDSSQ